LLDQHRTFTASWYQSPDDLRVLGPYLSNHSACRTQKGQSGSTETCVPESRDAGDERTSFAFVIPEASRAGRLYPFQIRTIIAPSRVKYPLISTPDTNSGRSAHWLFWKNWTQ